MRAQRLVWIWTIFIGFYAPAQAPPAFGKGLKEVGERHFSAAEKTFENFLEAHPFNYAAAYNAGNCKIELKKYGEAIRMFEKTLKYHPGDKNALRNIEYCYTQLRRNEPYRPPYGSYPTFAARVGANAWFWLLTCFTLVLCALIILFFVSAKFGVRRFCLLAGFICMLAGSFSGINLKLAENRFSGTHYAIIVKRRVPTFPSPDADAGKLELNEGERVRLIEQQDAFTLVKLEDGHEVYLRTDDFAVI